MLFVIDEAKALRKAIRTVFGEAPVQRCVRHKERNVAEHLPGAANADHYQELHTALSFDPSLCLATARVVLDRLMRLRRANGSFQQRTKGTSSVGRPRRRRARAVRADRLPEPTDV